MPRKAPFSNSLKQDNKISLQKINELLGKSSSDDEIANQLREWQEVYPSFFSDQYYVLDRTIFHLLVTHKRNKVLEKLLADGVLAKLAFKQID